MRQLQLGISAEKGNYYNGDWFVNTARFPNGLKDVKKKLTDYGMKMGLWFNPTVAAKTSEIVLSHPEYMKSKNGESGCGPVWETEGGLKVTVILDSNDARVVYIL